MKIILGKYWVNVLLFLSINHVPLMPPPKGRGYDIGGRPWHTIMKKKRKLLCFRGRGGKGNRLWDKRSDTKFQTTFMCTPKIQFSTMKRKVMISSFKKGAIIGRSFDPASLFRLEGDCSQEKRSLRIKMVAGWWDAWNDCNEWEFHPSHREVHGPEKAKVGLRQQRRCPNNLGALPIFHCHRLQH